MAVGGSFYAWLNKTGEGPWQLAHSSNQGVSWSKTNWNFPAGSIDEINFLQFGMEYAGALDQYVYMYAISSKGSQPAGYNQYLWLLRVQKDEILSRSNYMFFNGLDSNGDPLWTSDIDKRQPVFQDSKGVILPAASFNPGIGRYILTLAHGSPSGSVKRLGVFDAPKPWVRGVQSSTMKGGWDIIAEQHYLTIYLQRFLIG